MTSKRSEAKLEYSGGFSIGKNLNLKFLLLNLEIPQKLKGWTLAELRYRTVDPNLSSLPPNPPQPWLALVPSCSILAPWPVKAMEIMMKRVAHRLTDPFFCRSKIHIQSKLVILPLAIFHTPSMVIMIRRKKGRP